MTLVSDENFSRLISTPVSDNPKPLKSIHYNDFLAEAVNFNSFKQRETSIKLMSSLNILLL